MFWDIFWPVFVAVWLNLGIFSFVAGLNTFIRMIASNNEIPLANSLFNLFIISILGPIGLGLVWRERIK